MKKGTSKTPDVSVKKLPEKGKFLEIWQH